MKTIFVIFVFPSSICQLLSLLLVHSVPRRVLFVCWFFERCKHINEFSMSQTQASSQHVVANFSSSR